MRHIPGIINPLDDLTKPLEWVLHERHAHRIMGHYFVPLHNHLQMPTSSNFATRLGEGVVGGTNNGQTGTDERQTGTHG